MNAAQPKKSTTNVKANFLEFFYKHVTNTDWMEGLDLYQAGKVGQINDYHGLVTANVASHVHAKFEVRLKLHPSGKCIQWLECTCRKNRVSGAYCEHMAAFMISLDREKSVLLSNLDGNMPLKPPSVARKLRTAEAKVEESEDARSEGATEHILASFNGEYHSVSLLAHGPTLRVRLELKEGQLTHYDLPLDAAAKFLSAKPRMKNATPEVRSLKVHSQPAIMGTRIYQLEDEKIVAERVVGIKHTEKSLQAVQAAGYEDSVWGQHKYFGIDKPKGASGFYEFVAVKAASRHIGKECFFLPRRGFWYLTPLPDSSQWHELPLKKTFKEDEAAQLMNESYAEYLAHGPIWVDEKLSDPIIIETPKLSEIKVLKESDGWFYLDPRYGAGDSGVSMIELMKQFRKRKRKYLKSGNTWVRIPDFVKEHDWDTDETGELLKVNAVGLMRLRAAVGDFDQFVGSKMLLNQIRNAIEFTAVGEVPTLEHTNLNLREYQSTGVEWMWWLHRNHLHGLLADEMGLGKTHQAMGLMSALQRIDPNARFLIIAPTTVLDHWEDKVQEFCPNLKPVKYHGPKRSFRFKSNYDQYSTLITSYGVLLRDIKEISEVKWNVAVLDEAHFVKNNNTATYRAVCKINATIRLCLTGTPIENHLGELKNLFDFLVPGYLGSDEYFKRTFINPIESRSRESELALQKLIHPFKLRRTKEQVLKDLPAKVEDIRHTNLSDEQVRMYRNVIAMKANPLVEQLKNNESPIPYLHVFATLTMLKQICNHPALVTKEPNWRQYESGKFELLKEILEEALGSGHKVVIYSQYVTMISIISEYLTEQEIGHAVLTGQSRNRGKIIANFQENPDCKVFCGSLLAGGIGIDLTSANVVVHYDRWWNASKENQATDRVHRIGQQKNVQVLKLVNRGTLEEKIDALIRAKQALFEKFMDHDEEIFKALSRDELISLLT